MVFARIVVFVLTFALGLLVIRRSQWLVQNFGYMDWAEKYMGSGGTYSAWKLIGVLIIIWGFLYAVGTFSISPGDGLNLGPTL